VEVRVIVSNCVECKTTILGGAPRCPACHEAHARELEFYAHPAVSDDDVTAKRAKHESALHILLRWLVTMQFVAAIVLGAAIVITRGCPR
jgi:hypothetical protein